MKKVLIYAALVGLLIGVAQLFLTYEKTLQRVETIAQVGEGQAACMAMTPECGVCLGETKDDKCYDEPYEQKFRGFPFSSGSYGYDSRIDTTPLIYANVIIWTLGLPAIMYGILMISIKIRVTK